MRIIALSFIIVTMTACHIDTNDYYIECIGNVSYIVMKTGRNIAPVLQVDKDGNPVACSIQ
jgi:hypothetical protein